MVAEQISDSSAERLWALDALCGERDPEEFFVQGSEQKKVKSLCFDCPVQIQCLADALDNKIYYGVWGGMTERERRKIIREFPQVTDWLQKLQDPQIAKRLGLKNLEEKESWKKKKSS